MKYISTILIFLGIIFIFLGGYQYFHNQHKVHQTLSTVKQHLNHQDTARLKDKKQNMTSFNPTLNQSIGILEIPRLGKEMPIIEGTNPNDLAKGVGHYSATSFPGQGNPILLSGHRDTVFRGFGKLKKGDHFTIKLPYGEYQYQMMSSDIVDEDNQSVVQGALKGDKEKLLISTCYPFSYIGNAPKRYIIYASAVD